MTSPILSATQPRGNFSEPICTKTLLQPVEFFPVHPMITSILSTPTQSAMQNAHPIVRFHCASGSAPLYTLESAFPLQVELQYERCRHLDRFDSEQEGVLHVVSFVLWRDARAAVFCNGWFICELCGSAVAQPFDPERWVQLLSKREEVEG